MSPRVRTVFVVMVVVIYVVQDRPAFQHSICNSLWDRKKGWKKRDRYNRLNKAFKWMYSAKQNGDIMFQIYMTCP